MSLDVSHPALTAARQAVADPSDPTAWFLLQYNPDSPGPQAIPLDSGPLPVLPAWHRHLRETGQGVLFGYVEIANKGLVLVYLPPDVGGVKRARAIVHSRAIANMYPEYSALITIADPDELTEELVSERLGLGVPAPLDKARVEIPGGDGPNPLAPGLGRGIPLQKQRDATPMSAAAVGSETGSPSRVNFSERRKPPPQLSALGLGTPSEPASSSPSRAPSRSPSRPPPEPQAVAVPSVEQLKEKEKDDRNRKPSFTSRLKNTFHRSSPSIEDTPASSPSNTDKPTPLTPTSPSSPSMGSARFKAASLGKVFSKRRGGTGETPPTSPRADGGFGEGEPPRPISHDFSPAPGPALPPKDTSSISQTSSSPLAPSAPSLHAVHGHSPYPTATPPGGAPPLLGPPVPLVSRDSTKSEAASYYQTPLGSPSPEDENEEIVPNARSTSLLTPEAAAPPGGGGGGGGGLSPSPSARQVLYDARQKSLDKEREIQERFRRDLSEKEKDQKDDGDDVNGHGQGQGGSDGYESSTRLAYNDTDTEDERGKPTTEGERERVGVAVPPSLGALPASPVDDVPGGGTSPGLVGRGAFPSPPPPNGQSLPEVPEPEPEPGVEKRETHELEEAQQQAMMRAEMSALHTEQQAEKEVAEEAEDPIEREGAEEKARADGEIEERVRVEYEERVRREREREEEERERRRKEEEARERYLAEEERRREEEEEERRLAEEERLRVLAEEEERQRLEEEERAERQRLEEEERARVQAEQERKREEEEALAEKKRAEEAARAEKKRAEEKAERQRIEDELAKKQAIRDGLLSGKRDGGVMLRGWVTAQTYKSMTWRRRHFQLLPTEMRLFKNEGDAKPIQTIFFGPSTTISEAYEESQVKDSFKVISSLPEKGDEEFFLFTDSAEDKEVVLEGIRLCI
ncbi:hypothetical protein I350_08229 [Cryptococcus amylolentus CBS 6273]|uniref:PH domain-containing protein n=1 Tax=Cryptococcus amylolentus CBS 6273 TaxID=1296118 RepID=A0A1E3J8I3_9TREE|nr:hypothetical protein I350_08229 [Cryptococcus amylolentus CBS 6273]